MANLDDFKEKLKSKSWEERISAIKQLANMINQRDMVLPLLKKQLKTESNLDVFKTCVEALDGLGGLDDEVFQILKKRLSDDLWVIRREAVRALVKKFNSREQEVLHLLKERLEKDSDFDVIGACVESLIQLGMTTAQMSHTLIRNSYFPIFLSEWRPRGIISKVINHALYLHWRRLPEETKWPLKYWRIWEYLRHYHPKFYEMWHELDYYLRKAGPRQAEWLIAMMKRWWESWLWPLAFQDFEELMSLTVKQNIIYEELNILRFCFLDALATDRNQRPISKRARNCLEGFQLNWDELLRTEEQFDQIRDKISELHRQQEEIIREAETRAEGKWRWEPIELRRLPPDLQERWNEISDQLRPLEGYEEPGKLQQLQKQLEEATQRLLPCLREMGVQFRVIEVEGILGDYNFLERKITLYPPMIKLVAADLAESLQRQPEEVYEDLYTITEMHETAHAVTHLGLDSNGMLWERPAEASSELHETLAQFYTFQLIKQLKEKHLEQVFLELNKKQPERYTFWQVLQDVPREMVREFLVAKRTGKFQGNLLLWGEKAAKVIGNAISLFRAIMSPEEFKAYISELKPFIKRLEGSSTRQEFCNAIEAFLTHCASHPLGYSLLEKVLPPGFHSPDYLKIMLVSALTDGEPIRCGNLRLNLEQIKATHIAPLMQNDLVCRNEIVRQLWAIETLPI